MKYSIEDNNKLSRKREKSEFSSHLKFDRTIKSMNMDNISNARYSCDVKKVQELRKSCPWIKNPKFLTKAAISPSAVTKIMVHCQAGVEKGIKKGGRPIEVMGMLLGRPEPSTPQTLVITDVYPLSVEGFETSVVASDVSVANEMIRTAESIDRTRHERIMGWYHSHPFDVGKHSNCFLSSTDIQTQLNYQRSEDPDGNPWLAIVVDPLRSLLKKQPEIKAFRAYPPGYNAPENECPDGTVIADEKVRVELWGKCWASYYELQIEYFMSAAARNIMSILTQKYYWVNVLGSTQMYQVENREEFPPKVEAAAEKLKTKEPAIAPKPARGDRDKIYSGVENLATEALHNNISQLTKQNLFC